MRHLRMIVGLLALLGLAVALNLLVLSEDLSAKSVLVPLALGVIFGLAWLALRIATLTETYGKGKTLYGINSIAGTVLFFAICVVLYAFASRGGYEWDLTQEGRRELAPQTKQVLQALPSEVEAVAFFVRKEDKRIDAARDKTRRFLAEAQEYSPRLKVELVDPVEEPGRVSALNLEEKRLPESGALVLRSGTRMRVLPISRVTGRLEERDFTNALINVSRKSEPKVYVLQGHEERDVNVASEAPPIPGAGEGGLGFPDRGSKELMNRLLRESYQPDLLRFSLQGPKVPDDCDILIMNDPQLPLRPDEVQAIQEFLDKGGRMLMMLDPAEGRPSQGVISTWLNDRYGIVVGDNILLSPLTRNPVELYILPDMGKITANLTSRPFPEDFPGCFSEQHPITRGFDSELVLWGARSVELAEDLPEGVVGESILRSPPFTYAEDDRNARGQFLRHQDPDEPEGWPSVAVAVTAKAGNGAQEGRDARIVVMGDGEIASNAGMIVLGHINLIMNAVAWLSETEELIAIRPTGEEDQPILLTSGEEQLIAWIASLGVLQAVVAAGVAVHLWRRRYQ